VKIYKRSAPDLVPVSREGLGWHVQQHVKSCGIEEARVYFCPCDLTGIAICPGCRQVFALVVRGDSWCRCARDLVAEFGPLPFIRWGEP
jgi:hypothetical protein